MASAVAGVIDDLDEVVPAEVALLEDLQEMPPRPELASLLASIDRSALDAEGLLRVAQARQRLIAHQEAQLLADLHAIARAVPDQGRQSGRRDQPGKYPWAEVEVACALRWTYPRAADRLILADDVIDRLPAIFESFTAGQIDVPKALIMTEAVALLDDDLARGIIDHVIDTAPRLTTSQLRARLRRLVLAADPQVITNRAGDQIKGRRVAAYPDEHSHLATLAGYQLPPHRVAAAMERLDAVAKAAKAAGDQRKVDQLRADAYLDLLTGDGIAHGGPITNGDPDNETIHPAKLGPEDAITAGAPTPTRPADPILLTAPDHDTPPPADPEPATDLWVLGVAEPPEEHDDSDPVDIEQLERQRLWLAGFHQLSPTISQNTGVAALPAPRRGVVELQVPLATLIGWSQLPGELAGFAPVVADIARQITDQMHNATWKWSAYNTLGELAYHGTTNQRPEHHPARHPNAEQTAYVKARDRTCVAPGCRKTARMCDIDHTVAWADGGQTEPCNLGLLCRLHHLWKHSTGCELLQLSSGVFTWKTPAGLQYLTTPDTPLIDDNQLTGLPKP